MSILESKDLKFIFRDGFKLGGSHKYLETANASHDLTDYLLPPAPNSEFGIMSYNFPLKEWGKTQSDKWLGTLKSYREKGVTIKVLGGPTVQAQDSIRKLMGIGVQFRLSPIYNTFHILYMSEPRQLWIEEYHDYEAARRVHRIKHPNERKWQNVKELFDKVWERSTPMNAKTKLVGEDVNATHLIVNYLFKHGNVNIRELNIGLKSIVDKLHKKELAQRIYFAPDRNIGFTSETINESIDKLMALDFVVENRSDNLSYRLTRKGKTLPQYYDKMPSGQTLVNYSYLF